MVFKVGQPAMITCRRCGEQNESGLAYCLHPGCGAGLLPAGLPSTVDKPEGPAAPTIPEPLSSEVDPPAEPVRKAAGPKRAPKPAPEPAPAVSEPPPAAPEPVAAVPDPVGEHAAAPEAMPDTAIPEAGESPAGEGRGRWAAAASALSAALQAWKPKRGKLVRPDRAHVGARLPRRSVLRGHLGLVGRDGQLHRWRLGAKVGHDNANVRLLTSRAGSQRAVGEVRDAHPGTGWRGVRWATPPFLLCQTGLGEVSAGASGRRIRGFAHAQSARAHCGLGIWCPIGRR